MAGVILNFTGSDYHSEIISSALNDKGIKFLGALKRDDSLKIPERHLGLTSAGENSKFDIESLRKKFESSIDVDEILRLSENVKDIRPCEKFILRKKYNVRVAVANDKAFTFIYPESMNILERLGAEIIPFSPLDDSELPIADGYIFCGGYPEIFAERLADNIPMLESVRNCHKPFLAECGGMMYLCRNISGVDGRKYDMAGVIPFESFMSERAVMGYMTGVALRDNILCRKGEIIRGHEFHYSRVEPEYYGDTCAFELTRRNTDSSHFGGYAGENILASYLHVNFYGNENLAENFLKLLTSSKG